MALSTLAFRPIENKCQTKALNWGTRPTARGWSERMGGLVLNHLFVREGQTEKCTENTKGRSGDIIIIKVCSYHYGKNRP